ncbi:hypothetical protein [Fusobacterium polymorphum]|uniref:hypothetical protein n=1 Tax=Fusobacterium nucleatum subsp. polymorphum TaxID=76857 RepID=UPI003AB553A8
MLSLLRYYSTLEEVYKLWLENKEVKKSTMKNYVTNFNRSSILHKMPIDSINGLVSPKHYE